MFYDVFDVLLYENLAFASFRKIYEGWWCCSCWTSVRQW